MSLTKPLAQWPDSDRSMWARLLKVAGPLDYPGALSHLRQTSLDTLARRYGRWIGWLSAKDPQALLLPPHQRATYDQLLRWLEDLSHTRPMTQLMFVDGVLRVLRAEAPEADWTRQLKLKAHLKRVAGRGTLERKQSRILSSEVLLNAGLFLADTQSRAAATQLQAMKRLRDGCMIAFLALMPMRRRAFANLRLGSSILVTDSDILIALPEDLTKTGVPWEVTVPHLIEPFLRCYLEEARPFFLQRGNQDHDHFWVGERGYTYNADYLGQRIAKITQSLTDVRVPPHFFRDAAATTLARSSPAHARLIQPILGHTNPGTAERHYNHAQTIEAGRDYAALIRKKKDR